MRLMRLRVEVLSQRIYNNYGQYVFKKPQKYNIMLLVNLRFILQDVDKK